MDWLLSSIDATRPHELSNAVVWHARLMVLAWGFVFPIGILIARFLKTTPNQDWPRRLDNQLWWHSHWLLQSFGGLAVCVAAYLIWGSSGTSWAAWIHSIIGWAVIAFCAVQILSGLFRGTKGGPTDQAPDGSMRGDHFDMTPRRLAFEYLHKFLGYAALFISWAAIFLGLYLANAPVWMFVGLLAWFVLWLTMFIHLQKRGLALDTYQAIWGPDPSLPGNQRKPIGLGVRRKSPLES